MSKINWKDLLHTTIDAVGDKVIDTLTPTGSAVQQIAETGLDAATDLAFDQKLGEDVALPDHTDMQTSALSVTAVLLDLFNKGVLQPADVPFYEGENEEDVKESIMKGLNASVNQSITNVFKLVQKKKA